MRQKRGMPRREIAGMLFINLFLFGMGILGYIGSMEGKGAKETELVQARISEYQLVDMEENAPYLDIPLDRKWQRLIYELCIKNDFDYKLAISFFDYESEGFQTDLICTNKDAKGKAVSYDSGIGQINSLYEEVYRQHAIKYCDLDPDVKFDPLNPDHGIRAGIGGLVFYREYWKEHGISGEKNLFYFSLNSYNMGTVKYADYVKRTGSISRAYDREVFKRKEKLEAPDE